MSNKKSYMNKNNILSGKFSNNILSEGFFDKLFRMFNIRDKSLQKKIKKDKKLSYQVKNLNGATKDMEKTLRDITGKKIKLQKFSVLDFI